MIEKVMVCPYFGDYPPWMDHWHHNVVRLTDHGYTFVLDTDEAAFRDRVREILRVDPPPMHGTGRIWNFRPAFGLLYADEIGDADFWGHTDFDCVYGRVERWVTDEFLENLDVHSNHDDYICGPWTLYRNTPNVNRLFKMTGEWRDRMTGADYSHGWAEKGFTAIVDGAHDVGQIRRAYTKWQTRSFDDFSRLRLNSSGVLMEGDVEVMMAHFRRTKKYPRGCAITIA